MTAKTTRETLAELEDLAAKGDELMTRLVADLGAWRDDLEGVMRAASLARQTTASVIVEAAFILAELERGEPLPAALHGARKLQ